MKIFYDLRAWILESEENDSSPALPVTHSFVGTKGLSLAKIFPFITSANDACNWTASGPV